MTMEKRKDFIVNIIYYGMITAMVYFVVKYAFGLMFPFMIGFIVSFLLNPAISFISQKLRIPQKLVAMVLVLLLFTAAGMVISWIGIRAFAGIKEGVTRLPEVYNDIIEPVIQQLFDNIEENVAKFDPLLVQVINEIAASLSKSMGSIVSSFSSTAIRFVSSTVSFIPSLFLQIVLAVISTLFFAMDYHNINEYVEKVLPPQGHQFLMDIKNFTTGIGLKFIKAYAILMSITFIELAIGLSILRVEGAVVIAASIAVIDVLPVLGTGGVVIPWLIIEFIRGNTSFAIGLTILYLIITVIRNFLEPKLVGQQIGLHPLVILICLYVGVKIFGFIGLFALPLIVVIAKHIYDSRKQNQLKQVENNSEINDVG